MFDSILTVCIGNICRSPVAEAALAAGLPGKMIESSGLQAPSSRPAHETMQRLAQARGLDLSAHRSRRLDERLAARFDLILVMERAHRDMVARQFPSLAGRTMLLSQWTGGADIADPINLPDAAHEEAFEQIMDGAAAWIKRLEA